MNEGVSNDAKLNTTGTSDIVNINILVMGPSGTGKTSALLIPTLRSWQSRRHPHHLLARSQVCKFTFENRKTPNISRNCSLSGRFRTFLFDMRGFTMVGNITLSLMVGKPAICCFVAIEKRHIAAALLLCPEDGARGLFSYLLCFFLLATTAVPMAALPLTSIRTTSKAGLLVSPVCGMVY